MTPHDKRNEILDLAVALNNSLMKECPEGMFRRGEISCWVVITQNLQPSILDLIQARGVLQWISFRTLTGRVDGTLHLSARTIMRENRMVGIGDDSFLSIPTCGLGLMTRSRVRTFAPGEPATRASSERLTN